MFLFSGTFFPVENLPGWAQFLASLLPLTHLSTLTRTLAQGELPLSLLWNVGYLLLFSLIFFSLALVKMHKRLIK
jgi:lipooligosaccharide transport system permease protein